MIKYAEITERIIGCAMKVHRELSYGFQEYIYQRALEIELVKASVKFIREYEMPIYYSGEKIRIRKVDFFAYRPPCSVDQGLSGDGFGNDWYPAWNLVLGLAVAFDPAEVSGRECKKAKGSNP